MESNEEFVVVDEEDDSHRDTVARLDVLVDLFKQTIRTLNQSSILLKDELQTAISVTLQSSTPDYSSTVEHLVKQLDDISVSPDEVRKTYVRQLCSRLVAVNEEKQIVMTELVELNNQLRIAEEEARKWKKLIEPILKIETEINKLNSTLLSKEEPFSDETEPLSSDTTIDGVCDFLHSMHNKIQILHANACAMKKTDKITSDICTQVCVVNTSQTSSDKHCVNDTSSHIQKDEPALKFDTCLQAEVPLPPMVSSNAANRELPTYTNFAKEAIDQASVLKNIDLKGLIHAEILRVLSEQNHCFSTPNTTASLASVPVDNLLAPVAKTSPKQSVTPIANSVPSAPSILNLWPHLSFGGVSSKHVPPPLPESEELISPSEEVTGMSTINEFNLTSSSDNGPEIQQLSESQISDSNYGSWLSELGLNPCEESFNKPIERPSVPSFSVDEEQPWCPGCHRMFPSRADLEEHFNDCLL